MYSVYLKIKPYDTFKLKVSNIHEIFVEQSGNPKGKPIKNGLLVTLKKQKSRNKLPLNVKKHVNLL